MKSMFLIAALPVAVLSASSALALDSCIIEGDPAIFGDNMTAAFDVKSGQGCMHGMRVRGSISSSEITARPQHGTLKMTDKATWTYEPASGYKGSDSFAITTKGQSVDQKPGISVIKYNVRVN